jgi:hypothetical protein
MVQMPGLQADSVHTGPDELRAAPRFALILRAGKLVSPAGEFLCILRDISATGIKARLFHPLPAGEDFELVLGNGETHLLEQVWQREDHVGFRFATGPVDVAALLNEAALFPKRQIRLRLELPVLVSAANANGLGRLRDISQQGAQIESPARLALGEQVRLEAAGLPKLYAKVRWRRALAHGLVFEQILRLDELARIAGEVQQGIVSTA